MEYVTLHGQKYHETDQAILFGEPGLRPNEPYDDGKVWIPMGLIQHTDEYEDGTMDIEVPRWLAEKKDLEHLISEED